MAGARKLIRAKILKLHILKKAIQKSSFSQHFARNCVKISTEFRILVKGAQKLVRIRSVRDVDLWDAFPESVVDALTMDTSKNKLDNHGKDLPMRFDFNYADEEDIGIIKFANSRVLTYSYHTEERIRCT